MVKNDDIVDLLCKFFELKIELANEIRHKNSLDKEEEKLHHLQYHFQPFDAYYNCDFIINWS
jgi:hypothetical protein